MADRRIWPVVLTVEMGIETNNESSVRFGSVKLMVRFGFGCQNLWVRSVWFEMVLECFFCLQSYHTSKNNYTVIHN